MRNKDYKYEIVSDTTTETTSRGATVTNNTLPSDLRNSISSSSRGAVVNVKSNNITYTDRGAVVINSN